MGNDLQNKLNSPRLIRISEEHIGKYAIVSHDDEIISYGMDIGKIIKEAEKKGFRAVGSEAELPNAGIMVIRDPRKHYISLMQHNFYLQRKNIKADSYLYLC